MGKEGVTIRPGITALVRQLYAAEPDEQTWLEGIYEAAQEALGDPPALVVSKFRVTQDGILHSAQSVGSEAIEMLHRAPPDAVRGLFFSGPLSWGKTGVSSDPRMVDLLNQESNRYGVVDGLGLVGIDSSGHALVISFGVHSRRLSSSTRTTLLRLAGQMTTAHRLRRTPTAPAAHLDPKSGEVLEDMSLAGESNGELERAALAIERAQRQAGRDPNAALGLWKAMVEGKWSLVERFESDGRRILVAHPNAPRTRKHHALTEPERKVVSMVALGHSQKLVAYELGYSQAATSQRLKNALQKLGLKSCVELIELHGAIVG